jgi:hypothetical protein
MDFLKSSLTHPHKKKQNNTNKQNKTKTNKHTNKTKQNYTPIMEAAGSRVLSDDAHEAAIDLKKLEI